jgi:hypothetical protein
MNKLLLKNYILEQLWVQIAKTKNQKIPKYPLRPRYSGTCLVLTGLCIFYRENLDMYINYLNVSHGHAIFHGLQPLKDAWRNYLMGSLAIMVYKFLI